MAKFTLNILAKAKIKYKNSFCKINKIIATTLTVEGELIRDEEQIGEYTRYEYFPYYDIKEAQPVSKDDFYIIDEFGNKKENKNFEIIEIIEIFEEEIDKIEERF